MLKLIRAFLNAGVLEDGLVRPVNEGTPQGGPLSPFLSNVVLDDLGKQLARRGHRFCCYAMIATSTFAPTTTAKG
ncbi:reverse transcriptase domain-containing protein [Bradyrhizobium diazoefficiens]|uniref:reverse transcriptase domain-containing protein n=1 Tax=Bradyrhizobium diazoefficiens TaxID=1355477 RepID=UPI001FEF327D|nr:reverse transcriptase domain-containing protein [Bradyrhizobium diazoefficiens]